MTARDFEAKVAATVAAVRRLGSHRAAARELGCNAHTVGRHLRRAAEMGLTGDVRAPALGRRTGKVTTQVNAKGEIERQWLREHPDGRLDPEDLAALIGQAVREEITAPPPAIAAPAATDADLLEFVPLADLHNGLRSYGFETGEDYDLSIADAALRRAYGEIMARARPAQVCAIVGLGDITHADNNRNRTERSGHDLDADGRHRKTVDMTARLLVWLVRLALARFERVEIDLLEGNHDRETAGALAVMLSIVFEDEPRVKTSLATALWWWRDWGYVFLGATHGHTLKPEQMPGVMAADHPKTWGRTKFRAIHRGHHHNRNVVEVMGVPVECHRSPAAKDAYHAHGPHRSGRSVQSITYHKSRGEYARTIVPVANPESET